MKTLTLVLMCLFIMGLFVGFDRERELITFPDYEEIVVSGHRGNTIYGPDAPRTECHIGGNCNQL